MSIKLEFDKDDFGKYVDYRLLAVHTKKSFPQFVTDVAEHCHCTFSSLGTFIPANSDLSPHFKLVFTQFNIPGRDEQFAYSSVDKLNLVLMCNKTKQFEVKNRMPAMPANELTLFQTEVDADCYALNNKGVYVHNWPYADVDYFALVFGKKNRGVDDFLTFFSGQKTFSMAAMDHFIHGNGNNVKLSKGRFFKVMDFFQSIFKFSEKRIEEYVESEKKSLDGKSSNIQSSRTSLKSAPLF